MLVLFLRFMLMAADEYFVKNLNKTPSYSSVYYPLNFASAVLPRVFSNTLLQDAHVAHEFIIIYFS